MRNRWFALCIGVGVAIGVATENLAVWLAMGVAVGIATNRHLHGSC